MNIRFVQGVLWQLHSFDQCRVELEKELSTQILKIMDENKSNYLSSSSLNLIEKFNDC